MWFLTLAFAQQPAALPDPGASSRRISCIGPPGASGGHPGAESFFSGAFTVDASGNVRGEERRYLYANAVWRAGEGMRGGQDCKDVWTIKGRKVKTQKCDDCTFGIQLRAEIDTAQTSCKRRVTAEDNRFDAFYNVKVDATGSMTLMFPSGKVIGRGDQKGETFSWMSEQTCMWF